MRLLSLLLLAASCDAQQPALGRIVFPTSGPPAAKQRFLRGVQFLHSFEYLDARAEFQAARKLAPDFAMAAWGEAMTYNEPIWFARNDVAARAALTSLAPTPAARLAKAPTPREKDYLAAVEILFGDGDGKQRDFAYAAAMKRLHEKYPNDDEAAAFYALALLGTCHAGRNPRVYMQAAALLEDVLLKNREHPGALHYVIHCYDDPIHAPLGLRAARLYSRVAQDAPHALHMPSHIFFALGMWDEAAASNTEAWQASLKKSHRLGTTVEAGGYHALWWLEYANLQQGRYQEAKRILQSMEAAANANPSPLNRFHTFMMRAAYAIDTGEPYAADPRVDELDVTAQAAHLLAIGLSRLQHGQQPEAERALTQLKALSMHGSVPADQHSLHLHPSDVRAVEIMQNELAAALWMASGRSKDAIERMTQAAALEDQTPFEFGPPASIKPAHELFGEILLQLGQPAVARRQFEAALLRAPRRALSLLGLARSLDQSGEKDQGRRVYMELKSIWHRADAPLLQAIDTRLGSTF
jgi:hypothetical protein